MQSTAINTEQSIQYFTSESPADEVILIRPEGFREYDARWWYGFAGAEQPAEINLAGITAVGAGLAHMVRQRGIEPAIVVGHDLRSYSFEIKTALIKG